MIIHKSFKHGWFYHYRIHGPKTAALCNGGFAPLQDYLHHVKDHCPDEYFQQGPRGSALKFPIDIDLQKIRGHEVCDLAQQGLSEGKFKTAHSNVQMFMLQHDSRTISVEVPLWMLSSEYPGFQDILHSTEALTGHIDALRIEDGKIWVWDYKPNAHLEKYAVTQTNFYAIMLSKRTGIPLEKFRCGYFDDELAYVFRPIFSPKPN